MGAHPCRIGGRQGSHNDEGNGCTKEAKDSEGSGNHDRSLEFVNKIRSTLNLRVGKQ